MLFISFFLVSIAVIFFVYAIGIRFSIWNEKESLGIPEGKILYSDLNIPRAPLFSKYSGLIGKPDYIMQKGNHYIPVEVKSGGGSHPHKSQVFQLAVYCQILEEISGAFVPEGILVYNKTKYIIPFDPKLRFELESLIKTIRASLHNATVQRNHEDIARCRYCSLKRYCTDPVY